MRYFCGNKRNFYRPYLNFLFFARQSLAIRCTLVLQYSIAFSSSFVTSKPPCSFARGVTGTVVVSTVVTTVVVMVKKGSRERKAFPGLSVIVVEPLYNVENAVSHMDIAGCAAVNLDLGRQLVSKPRMYTSILLRTVENSKGTLVGRQTSKYFFSHRFMYIPRISQHTQPLYTPANTTGFYNLLNRTPEVLVGCVTPCFYLFGPK